MKPEGSILADSCFRGTHGVIRDGELMHTERVAVYVFAANVDIVR